MKNGASQRMMRPSTLQSSPPSLRKSQISTRLKHKSPEAGHSSQKYAPSESSRKQSPKRRTRAARQLDLHATGTRVSLDRFARSISPLRDERLIRKEREEMAIVQLKRFARRAAAEEEMRRGEHYYDEDFKPSCDKDHGERDHIFSPKRSFSPKREFSSSKSVHPSQHIHKLEPSETFPVPAEVQKEQHHKLQVLSLEHQMSSLMLQVCVPLHMSQLTACIHRFMPSFTIRFESPAHVLRRFYD